MIFKMEDLMEIHTFAKTVRQEVVQVIVQHDV